MISSICSFIHVSCHLSTDSKVCASSLSSKGNSHQPESEPLFGLSMGQKRCVLYVDGANSPHLHFMTVSQSFVLCIECNTVKRVDWPLSILALAKASWKNFKHDILQFTEESLCLYPYVTSPVVVVVF